MKLQPNPGMPQQANQKSSANWLTFVILLLLIALAVLGIMTIKRSLEAQQTSIEELDIKEATEFVNENPNSLDGRLALAYSFQVAERYEEAVEQYMEALNLDPENEGAWYNLGEISRINKDYQEAEERLTHLLENYEYHVLGSISLAQVYIETQKYDKAIEIMDKMIGASPRIIDFHIVKGQALEKKGDIEKAQQSYEQVLKYDPSNTEAKQAIEKLKQK